MSPVGRARSCIPEAQQDLGGGLCQQCCSPVMSLIPSLFLLIPPPGASWCEAQALALCVVTSSLSSSCGWREGMCSHWAHSCCPAQACVFCWLCLHQVVQYFPRYQKSVVYSPYYCFPNVLLKPVFSVCSPMRKAYKNHSVK